MGPRLESKCPVHSTKILVVDVENNTPFQQHHIMYCRHWYSLSKSHWELYVCIKQVKLFQPFYLWFTLYFFILQPKLLPFTFWGFSTERHLWSLIFCLKKNKISSMTPHCQLWTGTNKLNLLYIQLQYFWVNQTTELAMQV